MNKWPKLSLIVLFILIMSLNIVLPVLADTALPNGSNYRALNDMMNYIHDKIFSNVSYLANAAKKLFYYLIVIDLVLAVMLNFSNRDVLQLIVGKILKYGFIYYAIINYQTIIQWLIKGFIWIGVVGGSQATNLKFITDPSEFSNVAVRICGGVFAELVSVVNPTIGMIYFAIAIIIFLAMISIAINYFITYLEFYILAILSLVLIPFGANKYTSWIGQKVLNVIFAFGIKIMILSFLAAVSMPILQNWALPNLNILDPGAYINSMLYMVLGSLALAILSWHAPSLAASLLGGMPSLHGGSVFAPVLNTVGGVNSVQGLTSLAGRGATAAATGGTSAVVSAALGGLGGVGSSGSVGSAAQGLNAVRAASSMTNTSSNVNSNRSSNSGVLTSVNSASHILDRHGRPMNS